MGCYLLISMFFVFLSLCFGLIFLSPLLALPVFTQTRLPKGISSIKQHEWTCGHRCVQNNMLSLWVCGLIDHVRVTQLWSLGSEKPCHRSLLWRLNIGLLLRLDLFICHPTMHWEIEGVGGGGVFRRTTAGILQPNGHVFTLGCFLFSHCNEINIKK